MRSCRRFLAGIPHHKGDNPRVTHPSATPSGRNQRTFDLHVLGTPPAFILSQDQTRHSIVRAILAKLALSFSLKLTETASTNSCCSVFHSSVVKVPRSMKNMPRFQRIEIRLRETHEHYSPQKGDEALRDALLENHARGLLTRSCFPISINHVEIIAQVDLVVKCFLERSLKLSKSPCYAHTVYFASCPY